MDIKSLLNRDDIFPTISVCTPTAGKERVGKNRVERSCPSCGKKNHIRTTNCKSCDTQLRVSPSKPSTRSPRVASGRTTSRNLKGSVAAILNSPSTPSPWASSSLEFAADMFASENRRATEVFRGKHGGNRQEKMDFKLPDPSDIRGGGAARTVRNFLGSSRAVHKVMRTGNGRRAGDRTSRPCRNCSTQNHIRVTLCSKCRRSLRGSGS